MVNSSPGRDATRAPLASGEVAIVGMACMFPGAPDVDTFWHNIISKVDCITDPPPEAWDSDVYYDPESTSNDRVYCKKGGFLGPLAYFDPLEQGIPPVAVGGEPDQWLALKVAREALADAGYAEGPEDGERVEVILGKGTYLNHGNLAVVQHGLVLDQTLRLLKTLHPEYTDEELQALRQELKKSLPSVTAETVPGLIPNIIVGRIANRLNLMGPSYTVDAACASSLVAVEIAMHDLLAKRCDLAVVGGSQIATAAPVLALFCQLNALSRRQQIRPFDKDADGTILGEGIGMVILKRREDAERDGDRIYALIKGVGTSSDGRGLSVMAPRLEGEELALRRAYEMAGVSPGTVGLIEAHGTATPVGDATEIQALTRVFESDDGEDANRPRVAIGTVKSMIGHCMPASGVAGLIKTALALHHKVLPPTLNCDEPNPKLELEKTPFYVNTETRPWVHGGQEPRRAGINSFGFGGINAHAVLEEYPEPKETPLPGHQSQWDSEVFVLEGDSREALVVRARRLAEYVGGSPEVALKDLAYTLNSGLNQMPYRLSLVASTAAELKQKLEHAVERLADPACRQMKNRDGIYFFEAPLARQGKLAFLFPGEGAQYPNMLADLCLHFPEVRACFDQMDRMLRDLPNKRPPSDFIFPPPSLSKEERALAEQRLWRMDGAVEAVLAGNHALFTLLSRLGVKPDVIVGHSTGEYSAMRTAGILGVSDERELKRFAHGLNHLHRREVAQDGIPRALLVAAGADREKVAAVVDEVRGDLYVAMDNCPHQTVIAGEPQAAEEAAERMRAQGIICETLPFDRAYHTPLFKSYLPGLRELMEGTPIFAPAVETWSCTIMSPFPRDADAIRKLAVEHWERPVEFTKTIEAMYAAGVRLFVEVGPRGNLTAFVDDILRGRPYLALPANVQRRSGITQLNHLVGVLAAQGIPMRLDYLYARRGPKELPIDSPREVEIEKRPSAPIKLNTGWPPMIISAEAVRKVRSQYATTPAPQPGGAIGASLEPAVAAGEVIPKAAPLSDEGAAAIRAPQSGAQWAPPNAGGLTAPMLAYLQTMAQFLVAQEEVMRVYLGAPGAQPVASFAPLIAPPPPASTPEEGPTASVGAEPPATSAAPPPEETPQPQTQGLDFETARESLLALVSDRTGYPPEMLELNMDLEADLGIDSIKRIEILGAFRTKHGLAADDESMESVGELRTLQQILDFLVALEQDNGEPAILVPSQAAPLAGEPGGNGAAPALPAAHFPLIGEVTRFIAGEELTARREVRWDEDLYLHDHTLGRGMSAIDGDLRPLPVMPLTMSMEMLAEAGSLLMPGRVLVGMRNVQAHRWIKLEGDAVTLEITARRRPESQSEVEVKVFEAQGDGTGAPAMPLVEGTMVVADAYAEAPAVGELALRSARPSRFAPEQLYAEAMFHGPRWQGVASINEWGEDGNVTILRVIPFSDFFRSEPEPRFVTDPVVLDAAGQVVGFWTQEHLESGFVVFPYHLNELQIFGPGLPAGSRLRCQARIRLVGDKRVSSDIDILRPDGSLWMRLVGWADRRFDLPGRLYRFLLSPKDESIGAAWPAPVSSFNGAGMFECFRVNGLFPSDEGFWTDVFAHLTLSPSERAQFVRRRGATARRSQWMMGRLAAKDAVRALLKRTCDLELCPADVEVGKGEAGEPVAQGAWTRNVQKAPVVSLAHTEGLAVAVAGIGETGLRLGVDVERVRSMPAGFEEEAFAAPERELLAPLRGERREEWVMRLWCAKEAVGKGLGRGLLDGPQSVVAERLDLETGTVWTGLRGKLAADFAELADGGIAAYTTRDGEYVVATTLCERS